MNSQSENIELAKDFLTYALSQKGQDAMRYFKGFSINKSSFEKSVTDDEEAQESVTDVEGNEISWTSYGTTDEEVQELKEIVETMDTPSYPDNEIIAIIYHQVIKYIANDTDVDDAVNKTEKEVNNYLTDYERQLK